MFFIDYYGQKRRLRYSDDDYDDHKSRSRQRSCDSYYQRKSREMSRRRDRCNSRSEKSEFSEDPRQDRRSDSYNKGKSKSDEDIEKTASKTLENEQSVANGNALCSFDNVQNVDKASQEEELGKEVLEVIEVFALNQTESWQVRSIRTSNPGMVCRVKRNG